MIRSPNTLAAFSFLLLFSLLVRPSYGQPIYITAPQAPAVSGAEFQAVFDAHPFGGEFVIPHGSYNLDQLPIVLPEFSRIRGEGFVRLTATDSSALPTSTPQGLFNFDDKTHISFQRIAFNINASTDGSKVLRGHGITEPIFNIEIFRCHFTDTNWDEGEGKEDWKLFATDINNVESIMVTYSTSEHCEFSFGGKGTVRDLTFIGNQVWEARNGVSVEIDGNQAPVTLEGLVLNNNIFRKNWWADVYVGQNPYGETQPIDITGLEVVGNTSVEKGKDLNHPYQSWNYGIQIRPGLVGGRTEGVVVSSNSLEGPHQWGIFVRGVGAEVKRLVVTGNSVSGSENVGIGTHSVGDFLITGNSINSSQRGIQVNASSGIISGNVVSEGGTAIENIAPSGMILISGNALSVGDKTNASVIINRTDGPSTDLEARIWGNTLAVENPTSSTRGVTWLGEASDTHTYYIWSNDITAGTAIGLYPYQSISPIIDLHTRDNLGHDTISW